MSSSLILTLLISIGVSAYFIYKQTKFFLETKENRDRYNSFFSHFGEYTTRSEIYAGKEIFLIDEENLPFGSDLKQLVTEINQYVRKNVGTTDFSVIQNKTERKLSMRYDEAMARIAFPTYFGLMGTFAGVLMGIFAFIVGFGDEGATDESIRNLLIGVIVSMLTSFIGLWLTTRSNKEASIAKKKIDEDKNEFFDFIQNELMPTLDVSMVAALNKLHNTVNLFEPSFNRVIDRFQQTFDSCTSAFGARFQQNVEVVSNAVSIMGQNMDKVNENIEHQEKLLKIFKSRGIIETLERFVEVSDHFKEIMESLNNFERARRMMLNATNKVVEYQEQFNDSLKIPMEVAAKINAILNRITTFENSINALGTDISKTQLIGNNTIELIKSQINAINKKGKIAEKYIEKADDKLENCFGQQTKMIDEMNSKYRAALSRHIEDYEEQMKTFIEEMDVRRQLFLDAIAQRITVEQVHEDFSNLTKLNDIEALLELLSSTMVSQKTLHDEIEQIHKAITDLNKEISKNKDRDKDKGKSNNGDDTPTSTGPWWRFGGGK